MHRIDVVLYHAITILSNQKLLAFAFAIQSRAKAGEASFFATTVKYLDLFQGVLQNQREANAFAAEFTANAHMIMSACPGLVSLGLRNYNAALVASLLNHPLPRLKRLSLLNSGPGPLQHLPPNFAHLRYQFGELPLTLLQTVPLTHLHVTLDNIHLSRPGVAAMKQVLECMPTTIQLCVFSFYNSLL